MDKRISAYIEALVLSCTSLLSFQALPDEDKKSYSQKLRDHASKIIFETMLNRLDKEKLEELKAVQNNPALFEQKVEDFASEIPNLATDIEMRLEREFAALRENLG